MIHEFKNNKLNVINISNIENIFRIKFQNKSINKSYFDIEKNKYNNDDKKKSLKIKKIVSLNILKLEIKENK